MTGKAGISERRDRSVMNSGYQAIARVVGGLFEVAPTGVGRWASAGWYVALFLAGAVLWAYILNWGEIHFGRGDWAEGTGHRLAFLQNAVRSWQLPLHMPDGSALRNVTDRFMSTPDTILSPQVLLLGVLNLGSFVLANTLLLYAAGFTGMFLLARRLGLSAFAFGVVFVLFSLNGHITDHIVVGHIALGRIFPASVLRSPGSRCSGGQHKLELGAQKSRWFSSSCSCRALTICSR